VVWFLAVAAEVTFGAPKAEEPAEVIASTAWTAAFVRMAGVETVRVLAPYEMQHPPEYELKPSDIRAVAQARVIAYAGYETMVDKLRETAERDGIELVQFDTRNDLETITASVLKIATVFGTEAAARRNLADLERFFETWRVELNGLGVSGAPVIVHTFQQPMVRQLGFDVKGVFGPGPLEPLQIAKLSNSGAGIIIDNWHNQVGAPLEQTIPGARRAACLNFPGSFDTRSLMDVLEYNRAAIRKAIAEDASAPQR
jgi:hypothetical protein